MELHPQFRLNGTSYSNYQLLEVAQTWATASNTAEQELGTFLADWLSDNETLYLKTSGSTGTPKSIKMDKAAMRASAVSTGQFFGLSPNDTALLCLPLQYIAGKMMLVRAMILGLALDIVPPKTRLHLHGKTYDFAALIPLQVSKNIDLIHQIKTVLIGGAPIPEDLRKDLTKKHAHCVETYGMTETLTHVATRPVTFPTVPFQAMPDIGIAVDADSCLMLTVPYISPTPIITQDVVALTGTSSFQLLGRRDFVINSGGKKIFPEQLEEKLSLHLNIPFFFTGIPDAQLGEKLTLIIEGTTQEKARGLRLATKVLGANKHHVPKEVICTAAFVYTPSGKLDRKATKATIFG